MTPARRVHKNPSLNSALLNINLMRIECVANNKPAPTASFIIRVLSRKWEMRAVPKTSKIKAIRKDDLTETIKTSNGPVK